MYDVPPLPFELQQQVESELQEGEKLVWTGQPRPGLAARSAIPIVLFGIPWTAFSVFWVLMASGIMFVGKSNDGDFPGPFKLFACFPLFGIPFVLIGLAMLSSPYWKARQARNTCYAITDRRVIIFWAGWLSSVSIRSYGPEALGRMERNQRRDGSGDLIFETIISLGTDSDGHRTTSRSQHGFLSIDRVQEVDALIRKTLLNRPA